MKLYIAYKSTGEDDQKTIETLKRIREVLEKNGSETFVFKIDIQGGEQYTTMSFAEIIKRSFQEIAVCDEIFAYVASPEVSEGMCLEVGHAKALNKKFVLAINNSFLPLQHKFLRGLADETILFSDLEDLLSKLNS